MKLLNFGAEDAKKITQFGSQGIRITPIIKQGGWVQTGCIHFSQKSLLGLHVTPGPQLFMVVVGEGWVRTKDTKSIPIRAGQAAFWSSGEEHESGSETGMTVLVFEGKGLEKDLLLKG
ncbi:hypothetical protein SAMN05444487_11718 [Marininema mesophilum]|uniref:Cupin n=1 Tax=Marininema mesophilum TaxID=1048340 RepID=A0A1H3BJE4_9BACL|nr:hypothetical protein [Marininema mesophilum]SDX41861.1 hypothetical protein SAMN05444487_11718 [Marininema mesophilum]